MRSRLIYGWALFFIAIGTLLSGGLIFAAFFTVLAVMGGNEYIQILNAKGIKPSPKIIRGMTIASFLLAAWPMIMLHMPEPYRVHLRPSFATDYFPLLITIGVCLSFFRLVLRHENPPATIADIATTVLGFLYAGWLPCHIILLRNLVPPESVAHMNPLHQPGLAYTWCLLFTVFATDVYAFYAGKLFGKHLLFPQISPKKTVEGAIAGFLGAIMWSTIVVYLSDTFIFPDKPFNGNLWQAPLMGALVGAASQLGDLSESLLKRDAGVKDSGTVFGGHGGVLDRGDGLIFAAAVAYYWVCMVVLGIL